MQTEYATASLLIDILEIWTDAGTGLCQVPAYIPSLIVRHRYTLFIQNWSILHLIIGSAGMLTLSHVWVTMSYEVDSDDNTTNNATNRYDRNGIAGT